MRTRKLKWANPFLEENEVAIKEPQEYRGKWKELLQRSCLHVEIGTGKGDYWIGMSNLYPEKAWIGIEKNESVAAQAVKKSGTLQKNRRFIQADASNIDTWFAQGEVDVIHLNFSDPWPKNRTSKRRLSHASFLDKYKMILTKHGEIQMKTDNASLFEFSLVEFSNHGFYLEEISVDFRRETHDEDIISEYENKFMSKGNPIYRVVFKKR